MKATNNDDTHPCLSDRLRALGYIVDLDALPAPPTQTADVINRLLELEHLRHFLLIGH
ncbi:MAG: hypothetical protein F6K65_19150 [Moorea sp. SIO3C2]|nr:hypothetical protein [Moorena sp. SIO3C2]